MAGGWRFQEVCQQSRQNPAMQWEMMGGGGVRCSGGFSWGLVGNYGEEERGEVKRDLKASTDKS